MARWLPKDGSTASYFDGELLSRWLKHPFFPRRPPKSTGRELFGEHFLSTCLKEAKHLALEDILATLTQFTADSIALNYRLHLGGLPDEVILCGGGAKNIVLVNRIAKAIHTLGPNILIHSSAERQWDPAVIEGSAFALLAWKFWHQQHGNFPETTGARGPRVLGQLTWPP
jgi:anhydro-N-acetylmuramic acid kinase